LHSYSEEVCLKARKHYWLNFWHRRETGH